MILDVIDAVMTVGEIMEVPAMLYNIFSSHESPKLLAEMQDMGRTESESTAAYRWALEKSAKAPSGRPSPTNKT